PGFKSLDEVQAALQEILAAGDGPMDFPEDGLDKVREMRDGKFATWDFIYGHSHEADFTRKAKLPCGTVEASVRLDRGMIKDLTFSGDFLFDQPAGEIASSLIGCRFERSSISDRLKDLPVSQYFRGATAEDLLRVLMS
ncbi:MAG: hypothetical protein IK076_05460, partial [Bacteroidales bacterium]|nr:hypothetical protein [Bacteroidales bacterium]